MPKYEVSKISDRFEILEQLDNNSFVVKRIDDQKVFVLKQLALYPFKGSGDFIARQEEMARGLNEVRKMALIKHPNLIEYSESFFDDH